MCVCRSSSQVTQDGRGCVSIGSYQKGVCVCVSVGSYKNVGVLSCRSSAHVRHAGACVCVCCLPVRMCRTCTCHDQLGRGWVVGLPRPSSRSCRHRADVLESRTTRAEAQGCVEGSAHGSPLALGSPGHTHTQGGGACACPTTCHQRIASMRSATCDLHL